MKPTEQKRSGAAAGKPPLSLVVEQDPQSLREKTVAKLREAIIAGYFEPGEQLVERDVCAKTDVSRTSLREALRHLETEGVVESRKGEGVFVKRLTLQDVRDIYELRMALDAEAARHFSERATDAQRDRLKLIAAQSAEVEYDDFDRVLTFNNEFYEILYEGSGNKLSSTIMRSLQTRISLLRAITQRSADKERYQGSVALMRGIVAEVDGGNPRKAATLCRQFAARSLAFALTILAKRDAEPMALRAPAHPRRTVS